MPDQVECSGRDREIVEHVRDGMTIDDIASHYDCSRWTIRDRVRVLRARLGASTMADLPAALDRLRAEGRVVDTSDQTA